MWHDPTPLGAVSMWIHRQCMDIATMMAAVQVFWQSNGVYGMGCLLYTSDAATTPYV